MTRSPSAFCVLVDEHFLSGVGFGAFSAVAGAVVVHVGSLRLLLGLDFGDHGAPAVAARHEAGEGEVVSDAFGLVCFALVEDALDGVPCLLAREGRVRSRVGGPLKSNIPL